MVALSFIAHGQKDHSQGLSAVQGEVVGGAGEGRMQSGQETSSGGAALGIG